MGITENAAYLKGLFEGYELDKSTKEGKIISEMLTLLADMADKINALEADNKELHEYVEELDHDLGELEEEVYFYDDDEDDYDDFGDWDDDEDEEDEEEEDYEDIEEGFDFGDEESTIYEVECACGEIINFDEDTLEEGSIICPKCGEKTRVGYKILADGTKSRMCKKCMEVLDD